MRGVPLCWKEVDTECGPRFVLCADRVRAVRKPGSGGASGQSPQGLTYSGDKETVLSQERLGWTQESLGLTV